MDIIKQPQSNKRKFFPWLQICASSASILQAVIPTPWSSQSYFMLCINTRFIRVHGVFMAGLQLYGKSMPEGMQRALSSNVICTSMIPNVNIRELPYFSPIFALKKGRKRHILPLGSLRLSFNGGGALLDNYLCDAILL